MSPFCELLVVLRNLHTTFIYVFNAAFARLYSHGPEVSMAFPSPTLHKLWYTQFLSHLVPFSSATAASKNLPEKKTHISIIVVDLQYETHSSKTVFIFNNKKVFISYNVYDMCAGWRAGK